MAKKIRKGSSSSPMYLFIELLVPWLVMGLVAILLFTAGVGVELIFFISIICALGATVLMREFERIRRRSQAKRNG